jgi:hypothetical protein
VKEKAGIKAGKIELIPVTKNIGIDDVEMKTSISIITEEERAWAKDNLSEYDVIFVVCGLEDNKVIGNVMCKSDTQSPETVELLFKNVDDLSVKDFCNIVYYSSQWSFKFANKNKALLLNNNFDKNLVNRLKLLEFKKSERDGYLERINPDNDPTAAIVSVLSGL